MKGKASARHVWDGYLPGSTCSSCRSSKAEAAAQRLGCTPVCAQELYGFECSSERNAPWRVACSRLTRCAMAVFGVSCAFVAWWSAMPVTCWCLAVLCFFFVLLWSCSWGRAQKYILGARIIEFNMPCEASRCSTDLLCVQHVMRNSTRQNFSLVSSALRLAVVRCALHSSHALVFCYG